MHHASCMLQIYYHFWIHRWPFHISWDSQCSLPAQSTYACLDDLVKHSVYPAAQVLHLGNKMNLWDWDRILGFPQSRSLYICSPFECLMSDSQLSTIGNSAPPAPTFLRFWPPVLAKLEGFCLWPFFRNIITSFDNCEKARKGFATYLWQCL